VNQKIIGVLMGGLSTERNVSLNSGTAVLNGLLKRDYNAIGIDVGHDLPEVLRRENIEVAFIALHGSYGEDGCVQGMLELLGIPYTGSGVLASALAMHKRYAKSLFLAHGLMTAPFCHFRKGDEVNLLDLPFGLPVVVKPAQSGSSVGITIVKTEDKLANALDLALLHDDEILVEQYIRGKEIQIGILDDRPVGAIEIVPKNEFYDYDAKYNEDKAEHIYPARLDPGVYDKALATGLAAHQVLGCSNYSRVDLLVTDSADCYVLEVNTLPGMTSLSLLPEIASKGAGLSFEDLVIRIVEGASIKKAKP
jgi:D-alanine-D-alanine ligase